MAVLQHFRAGTTVYVYCYTGDYVEGSCTCSNFELTLLIDGGSYSGGIQRDVYFDHFSLDGDTSILCAYFPLPTDNGGCRPVYAALTVWAGEYAVFRCQRAFCCPSVCFFRDLRARFLTVSRGWQLLVLQGSSVSGPRQGKVFRERERAALLSKGPNQRFARGSFDLFDWSELIKLGHSRVLCFPTFECDRASCRAASNFPFRVEAFYFVLRVLVRHVRAAQVFERLLRRFGGGWFFVAFHFYHAVFDAGLNLAVTV